MKEDFYDKVAKKFGGYGYSSGPVYKSEYPAGNPERIFKQKLLKLSTKSKVALDIGCADGKFTLSVAPHFKKVYGIDTSKINLEIAKSYDKDKRSKNVEYSYQDASHTSFEDSFFDTWSINFTQPTRIFNLQECHIAQVILGNRKKHGKFFPKKLPGIAMVSAKVISPVFEEC